MPSLRALLSVLLLIVLTGCGGGDDGTSPPENPSIEISAPALQATLQAGSTAQTQNVSIRNAGGGNLAWSASSSAPWVGLSPASGSLAKGESGTTAVTVNPAGLAPATYHATVTISAASASNGPQVINVTLVVTAPPALSMSNASLSFAVQAGTDPPGQVVTIGNTGGGVLNWAASEEIPWLTVGPATGTLSSTQSASIAVSIAAAGMSPGTYSGNVTISAPGAENAPRTLPITLTITPAPAIGLSASSLAFTAEHGANPPGQTLTITNTGGGTLNWTASEPIPWLVGSPGTGSLSAGQSASLSLSVNTSGLQVGTYGGSITVSAPGSPNSPQTVSVSLTVTPAPALAVSPGSLSFTAQQGSTPVGQNLAITNSGGGALTWTASEAITWLVGTPGTGTLGAGQTATVAFSLNMAGVPAGTYTGTITITAPGAENSPRTVPVTLTVTALPPSLGVSPASLSFTTVQGSSSPGQSVTISNAGGGPLSWSAGNLPTWVGVTPASGVVPAGSSVTVAVSVNAAGLNPGNHSGELTFSAPGAISSPRSVLISAAVVAAPTLAVTPLTLTYTGQVGSTPATQTFTITNAGGGQLSWTASESVAWLNLSSASGTLAAGASASVTASVNTANLAADTYAGSITVAAAGVQGSPKMVSVSLALAPNVLAAPVLVSPADDATGVSSAPTLSWNAVPGANRYWVTVATSPAALPTDPNATTCPGCVFTTNTAATSVTISPALAAGTTYHWRVQGYNNSTSPTTQGQFSTIRSFRTTAPAPVLRVDGGTESTKPIGGTFNLTGSGFTPGGTATRHLREPNGTVSNIGSITASGTGTIALSFSPVCTTPLGTHTLWVVDNTTGLSSNTVNETVTSSSSCNLFPAPTLISPANGATGVSTMPTFSWSAVSGANRYWLMVASDPGAFPSDPTAETCSGCIVSGNTGTTSHTLPNGFPNGGRAPALTANTQYYWKVQAWNTDGRQGQYSGSPSFRTAGGGAIGNDYPYPTANPDAVDPWNFYYRQCTSFAAWRIRTRTRATTFTNQYAGVSRWGHATEWDNAARTSAAQSAGVSVHSQPAVGRVAQWEAGYNGGAASFGHVAYVAEVYSDGSILIEEYNYSVSLGYGSRRIAPGSNRWPSVFIQF